MDFELYLNSILRKIDRRVFLIGLFSFIVYTCLYLQNQSDGKPRNKRSAGFVRRKPVKKVKKKTDMTKFFNSVMAYSVMKKNKNDNKNKVQANKRYSVVKSVVKKNEKHKKKKAVQNKKGKDKHEKAPKKVEDEKSKDIDVLQGQGAFASAAAQVSRLGKKKPEPKPVPEDENPEVMYRYHTKSPFSSSIVRSGANSNLNPTFKSHYYDKVQNVLETVTVVSLSLFQVLFPTAIVLQAAIMYLSSNCMKGQRSQFYRKNMLGLFYATSFVYSLLGFAHFYKKCNNLKQNVNRNFKCVIGLLLMFMSGIGFVILGYLSYRNFYLQKNEETLIRNDIGIGGIGYGLAIIAIYYILIQNRNA